MSQSSNDTRRNDVREVLEEIMGAVNARKLAESRAAACTHLPRPRLRDVVIGEPSPMRAVCISCVAELVEQLRAPTQMLIERLAATPEGKSAAEADRDALRQRCAALEGALFEAVNYLTYLQSAGDLVPAERQRAAELRDHVDRIALARPAPPTEETS